LPPFVGGLACKKRFSCSSVRTLVDFSDVGALRVLVVGDSWVKQCVDGSYRVLGVREFPQSLRALVLASRLT
jgi:hypothetical protein